MSQLISQLPVQVVETPEMGRGVFTTRRILKGETVECCAVIPLSKADQKQIGGTCLENYVFAWGEGNKLACVALGFGSLYNHSSRPNATFVLHQSRQQIEFIALRDIRENEQVFIDYGWGKKHLTKMQQSFPPAPASLVEVQINDSHALAVPR